LNQITLQLSSIRYVNATIWYAIN